MKRLALALIVVSACSTGAPPTQEVVVSGAGFTAVQGETSLMVRSVVTDVSGSQREVLGAVCAVRTSLYEAELTTPARLVVPNFGPQSPVLRLRCVAGDLVGEGQRSIRTTVRGGGSPYFGYPGYYDPWRRWGWYGPTYVVSSYSNIAVELSAVGAPGR